MGLAERRAAKKFETESYPRLKKDVNDAAGYDVPMEVEWDTLAIDEQSHLYDEYWPQVYFQPLKTALKEICQDDMGKEALKGALKKIIIRNTKNTSYGASIATFDKGVLTLDHLPTTNI